MCALVKGKAAEFFQPRQLGVAVVQGQRRWPMLSVDALRSTGCIEEHWMDKDFVVLKVDMRKAFNMEQSLMSVLHFSLSCYLGHRRRNWGGGGGQRGPWPPPILGIMCIKYAEFILDTPFGPPKSCLRSYASVGCCGAMGPILCCGTLLAGSAPSLECSKVTP